MCFLYRHVKLRFTSIYYKCNKTIRYIITPYISFDGGWLRNARKEECLMTLNLSGKIISHQDVINPISYMDTLTQRSSICMSNEDTVKVFSELIDMYKPFDSFIDAIYVPIHRMSSDAASTLARKFGKLIIAR